MDNEKTIKELFIYINNTTNEFNEFMNCKSEEYNLDNVISTNSNTSILFEIKEFLYKKKEELLDLFNKLGYTQDDIKQYLYDNLNSNVENSNVENSNVENSNISETDEAWIVNNIKIIKDSRCCYNKWGRLDVCRHDVVDTVTNIKTRLRGNEICYFLKKHNFSISHFDKYKSDYEYFRKQFDPTPEDIIQKEVEKAIKEEQEKKLAEELKKMDEITNKYKASSRLDKLKGKNNIK